VGKRRKQYWALGALAGLVSLILLSPGGRMALAVARAASQSTDGFIPIEGDPRIRFERSSSALAEQVAGLVDKAVATVERAQGSRFAEPITIYVCGTRDGFRRFTPTRGDPAGVVFLRRLFLSPKLASTPERVEAVLVHELSHLHLNQAVGDYGMAVLPAWFREGLAVHVSGGGGAERVSEAEAAAAIAEGKTFVPEPEGSLLFPQSASRYGLHPHMFYRQAAIFIAILQRRDPEAFAEMLALVYSGQTIGIALKVAYREELDAIWRQSTASSSRALDSGRSWVDFEPADQTATSAGAIDRAMPSAI
jgi:hypothetical protein